MLRFLLALGQCGRYRTKNRIHIAARLDGINRKPLRTTSTTQNPTRFTFEIGTATVGAIVTIRHLRDGDSSREPMGYSNRIVAYILDGTAYTRPFEYLPWIHDFREPDTCPLAILHQGGSSISRRIGLLAIAETIP